MEIHLYDSWIEGTKWFLADERNITCCGWDYANQTVDIPTNAAISGIEAIRFYDLDLDWYVISKIKFHL